MLHKKAFLLLLTGVFLGFLIKACTLPDNTEFPDNDNFRLIGSFDVSHPAYLYDDRARDTDPDGNLLMTSFYPAFHRDYVASVNNLEATVAFLLDQCRLAAEQSVPLSEPDIEILSYGPNANFWPNEVQSVPEPFEDRLECDDAVTIAYGFLVPISTIQNGAICLLNVATGELQELTPERRPPETDTWWYHHVHWRDMNDDGLLDIVTARAEHNMKAGKLVWLEQPAADPAGQRWTEHVIGDGPDVNFVVHDIDEDGQEEIIATELYNERLSVWWQTDNDSYASWKGRVVDPELGPGFDLSVADLNNDGTADLLATNHTNHDPEDPNDVIPSSVFAYEFPPGLYEYRTADWQRHVLLTDIITPSEDELSPGRATAFHPNVNDRGIKKPWIHIDGDGTLKTHILQPVDPDNSTDWTYQVPEHITLVTEESIIGQSAIKDVNGDGWVELFIPAYNLGKVFIFTFAPETSSL